MRALFSGSRDWHNQKAVEEVIAALPPDSTVIHGGARGLDKIAGVLAHSYSLPVKRYAAEWNKLGKAAGPIRNLKMIKEGHPDHIYIFFKEGAVNKGSKNMLRLAIKNNIPLTLLFEKVSI